MVKEKEAEKGKDSQAGEEVWVEAVVLAREVIASALIVGIRYPMNKVHLALMLNVLNAGPI